MFLKELKEFSDGELTISFTIVSVDLKVRSKVISKTKLEKENKHILPFG